VMSNAAKKMKVRCLNNLAATQLKVYTSLCPHTFSSFDLQNEAYNECLESCEKVLELDKDNVKALFRSGKVMLRKGESAHAIQYLRRAQELNPNEKVIVFMVRLFIIQHV